MSVRRVRRSADEGVALVVALLVTLLVFTLTTVILADAFHNVVGSARSRESLTAVNAAESGVSWYTHALESTSLGGLRSSPWTVSSGTYTSASTTVAGAPGSGRFTVSVRYWTSYAALPDGTDSFTGGPLDLSLIPDATAPESLFAEVTSTGAAGGVTRKIRSIIELRPLHGTLAGAFAGIFICELGNRFTITGPSADVYLISGASGGCPNTDLVVTSGQFTTTGSVYVLNGGANLTNYSKIAGSLWAQGGIRLGNVDRPGLPVTSQCDSTRKQIVVCGDVTSISQEPLVDRTQALVLGKIGRCSTCSLPSLGFASIDVTTALATFPAPSPWTKTEVPSLPAASGWFQNTGAASNQLWVLAKTATAGTTCTKWQMPSGTLYLSGDMAIVSPCGFEFGGRVDIRKGRNAAPGTTPTLYLMSGYTSTPCGTDPTNARTSLDARDIVFKQNFDASAVRLYVYTPCKLIFTNQTNITGQVLARQLYAQGQTTINTVNLLGLSGNQPGPITAFQARVLALREI